MTSSLTDQTSCMAAVFVGADRPLQLQEITAPVVAEGEAIVRVKCCTLCGSDLHTITGARNEPCPSILGHEVIGTVFAVGDPPLRDLAGEPLKPGDRITWGVSVSCNTCDRCVAGIPQKCRSLFKYGHQLVEGRTALSGGLADTILLLPGSAVAKLPVELPDEVACPANCATATVAAAFRAAGTIANARILIFGAGMLGLTASAFAKTRGASQIVICDPNSMRLQQAEQFGASALVPWHDDSSALESLIFQESGCTSFDIVLELSGAAAAVEYSCLFGDIGARVILVGSVAKSRPVLIDPESIVRRIQTIRGVHNYAPEDLQTAIDFLTEFHSTFPFANLVEPTFSLAEVNDAVEFAIRNRPVSSRHPSLKEM